MLVEYWVGECHGAVCAEMPCHWHCFLNDTDSSHGQKMKPERQENIMTVAFITLPILALIAVHWWFSIKSSE
jgi:hypothetical protein